MLKNAKGLYLSALLKWLISHRQLTQFAGNINFESSVGTTIEKIYNYGTEGWPIADSFQNILNFICYSIPTGIFLVQNQKKKIRNTNWKKILKFIHTERNDISLR